MKSLFFFTDTFPLSGLTESSFILPEIQVMDKSFDRITILPENKAFNGKKVNLPEKFSIDQTFCNQDLSCNNLILLRHLFKPFVLQLLFKEKKRIKNRYQFFSFLRYINKALFYKAYINKLLANGEIDSQNTVFYSFWFSEITFALAMLCDKYHLTFFCRAHGYDLYDERVVFRSHAIRAYTLSKILHVYPCSKQGRDYMKKQYLTYNEKISVSYLGCKKIYNTFNPSSEDLKTITFFTCARLHSVKRLPMTYNILADVAKYFKDIHVYWQIIGEGDERSKLETLIIQNHVPNFTVSLCGAKSNEEVHKIYSKKHIDWGILLSESEGLSISVCEQLAYKIPVIVTNVGGLPEVVDESNGILLSPEPTSNELISKLTKYINNAELYDTICNNAYDKWSNNYNSNKNRMEFMKMLSVK